MPEVNTVNINWEIFNDSLDKLTKVEWIKSNALKLAWSDFSFDSDTKSWKNIIKHRMFNILKLFFNQESEYDLKTIFSQVNDWTSKKKFNKLIEKVYAIYITWNIDENWDRKKISDLNFKLSLENKEFDWLDILVNKKKEKLERVEDLLLKDGKKFDDFKVLQRKEDDLISSKELEIKNIDLLIKKTSDQIKKDKLLIQKDWLEVDLLILNDWKSVNNYEWEINNISSKIETSKKESGLITSDLSPLLERMKIVKNKIENINTDKDKIQNNNNVDKKNDNKKLAFEFFEKLGSVIDTDDTIHWNISNNVNYFNAGITTLLGTWAVIATGWVAWIAAWAAIWAWYAAHALTNNNQKKDFSNYVFSKKVENNWNNLLNHWWNVLKYAKWWFPPYVWYWAADKIIWWTWTWIKWAIWVSAIASAAILEWTSDTVNAVTPWQKFWFLDNLTNKTVKSVNNSWWLWWKKSWTNN